MSITNLELRQQVHDLRFEPTRVFGLFADLLENEFSDQGAQILDPSQPLPFLMENDAVLTAAAVDSYHALLMKQYPRLAQTESDLFLHLSDVDLVGMFASPGSVKMSFMFSKAEIMDRAVQIGTSQSRKIVIPKHTSITVNGVVFTMQYAINITVKPHGGIEVVYDGSEVSPLQHLTNGRIDWSIKEFNAGEGQQSNQYLLITVPVNQMRMVSYKMNGTPTSILKKTLRFENEYVHARAYRQHSDGHWSEIKTTHSDLVFDPLDPTLKLNVTGQDLTVELPYVYQMTNLATATLRVDIYSTLGDLYMDLSSIPSGLFIADFKDLDNTDNGRYSAPLGVMEVVNVMSMDVASGGRSAPSFLERRERMLKNAVGPIVQPLSHEQLDATLNELGFDVVVNRDDAFKRMFIVSRRLPEHVNGLAKSPIDSAVMTAKMTINEILERDTVTQTGDRVTILPDTLYRNDSGRLSMLTEPERQALTSLSGDALVNELVTNRYLYTPLHYVLDTSDNRLEVRPYHLTNPKLDIPGFSATNETIDVFVQSSSDMVIEYDPTGYTVTVITESNQLYKDLDDYQVFVQLAFQQAGDNEWVYANGTLIGTAADNERIFQFRIDTTWNIDPEHMLSLSNFTLRVNEPQTHRTRLQEQFYLIWGVSEYFNEGLTLSEVDDNLGRHLLPTSAIGVYRETLPITFGQELTGLWARSRPMVGDLTFKVHEFDVPKRYLANVYETDPDTGLPVVEVVDGKKQLTVLHAKGEVEMDPDTGEPILLFRAGSPMLDEYGRPIPEGERDVQRWWDVVLFDAQYRFATREQDIAYTNSVADALSEWINDTLQQVRDLALDRTEFYFQPRNTFRFVPAILDNGVTETIYSAQLLVVDLYLTDDAFRRSDVRPVMEEACRTAINAELKKTTVSRKSLETAVGNVLGEDVVTVSINGLADGSQVVSLVDPTTRLTISKRLTVESDGTLAVKDGTTINFHRHNSNG